MSRRHPRRIREANPLDIPHTPVISTNGAALADLNAAWSVDNPRAGDAPPPTYVHPSNRNRYSGTDALILAYIDNGGDDPFWVPQLKPHIPVPEHGTPARYQRERRIYKAACDACREANRLRTYAWYKANKPVSRVTVLPPKPQPTPRPAPQPTPQAEEPTVSTPLDMAEEVFAAALARKVQAEREPEKHQQVQRHPATITAERILRAVQVYENRMSAEELGALIVSYRALTRIGNGAE